MSTSRQTEKIVTIYRRPKSTNLPEELYTEGRYKISSTWVNKGKDIKRGITAAEEKLLMPGIIGVSANDPTFSKEVRNFFANMVIHVPADAGVPFNIAMYPNEDPATKKEVPELPYNPLDYVQYRFCIADPAVAETEAEMRGNSLRLYYVEDLNKKKEQDVEALQLRRKAQAEYLKLGEDETTIDWLLTMLGTATQDPIPVDVLDINDKDLLLDKFTKSHPGLFYSLATDSDLRLKAMISTGVSKGYLEKQGDVYFYGDIKMGTGLEQAVRFTKDPANSKIFVALKASLAEEGFVLDTVEDQIEAKKKVKAASEAEDRRTEKGKSMAETLEIQDVGIAKVKENDTTGNARGGSSGTP